MIYIAFDCARCGWCCKNIVINIAYSDITRWKKEKRWDILKEISYIANYGKMGDGFYIAKTTFAPKQPCPFLIEENGITTCTIHNTEPRACKDFPLGHANPLIHSKCPAFTQLDEKENQRVKKEQYKDFKKTYHHQDELFKIIIKARQVIASQS